MIGIEEVMQRISLPEEARKTVRHMDLTQVAFEAWSTLFYEDMEEFLARWNQLPDKHAWALGFYIRLAAEVHDRYREKGIEACVYDRPSMILPSGARNAIGSTACMGWKNFGGWASP